MYIVYSIITVSFLLFGFGIIAFLYLRKVVLKRLPVNAPNALLMELMPGQKRIVFAGDSNTHANMSFNWIELIHGDFDKVNAGINGDLSHNLLSRIKDIIACKPDLVCILIGTNDVNATMSATSKRRYIANGKFMVDEELSIGSFVRNLEQIIRTLKSETNADLAIMSLPLIGEDLNSPVNLRADEYSEVIGKLAVEQNIYFIDIRTELKQYVRVHQHFRPPNYNKYYYVMLKSIFLHFYFGYTFDKLSSMNGMLLSHDQLHQNSVSGGIIAENVSKWIKEIGAKTKQSDIN